MIDLKFTTIDKADLICHGGKFHADDVFSTVFLCHYFDSPLTICRVNKISSEINQKAIIYDIGLGKFDHHQKGGNGCRENGIPYASFGLLWKEFGMSFSEKLSDDSAYFFEKFDHFAEGIDAYDNGLFHDLHVPTLNISNCITLFNPNWDSTEDNASDSAFGEAVNFADLIFCKEIKNILSLCNARKELSKQIMVVSDNTLFLKKYIPFSVLPNLNESVKFIVFPSLRGGYNLQIVDRKLQFSRNLSGLSGLELQAATRIKTGTFIHSNGYLAGAETLSDTLKMRELIQTI